MESVNTSTGLQDGQAEHTIRYSPEMPTFSIASRVAEARPAEEELSVEQAVAAEPEQPPASVPEVIHARARLEEARRRRAAITGHLIEARDASGRVKGIGLQQDIIHTLGFADEDGAQDFQVLRQMGVVRLEHDPRGHKPDVITVDAQAIRKNVKRGYLPSAIGRALDYRSRHEQVPPPQPPAQATEAKAASPPSELSPWETVDKFGVGSPEAEHNDPPQLDEEDVAGRYEKHASISEAAAGYWVTPEEVAQLEPAEFLLLALTTPALDRSFSSSHEFGGIVVAETGLRGRALGKLKSYLTGENYAQDRVDGYGLELTPEGEQFLREQITAIKQ